MQKNVFISLSIEELKQIIMDSMEDFSPTQAADIGNDEMNQKQAAKFLGVSETTIIKYKREGKIPYEQLPGSTKVRFYKSELRKTLSQNRHLLQPSRK